MALAEGAVEQRIRPIQPYLLEPHGSKHLERFSRLQRRAAILNRGLGGEGWSTWDTPPPKPKWMRWRTYDRKYEIWKRTAGEANAEFTVRAARILKWL